MNGNCNDENNYKLYFFVFVWGINLDNIPWLRQTGMRKADREIFIRRDPIEVSSICL